MITMHVWIFVLVLCVFSCTLAVAVGAILGQSAQQVHVHQLLTERDELLTERDVMRGDLALITDLYYSAEDANSEALSSMRTVNRFFANAEVAVNAR